MNSLPADKLQEIQKAIELFSVGQGPAKTMEEATRRSYQFWDTQPVPKLGMTFCQCSQFCSGVQNDLTQWMSCIMGVFASCQKRFRFPSGETVTSHGSIEPDKDNIREEPYSLPHGFSWDTLDLGNPAVVRESITHKRWQQEYTRKLSFISCLCETVSVFSLMFVCLFKELDILIQSVFWSCLL